MVRAPRFSVKSADRALFTSNAPDEIQTSELAQLAKTNPREKIVGYWAEHILTASVRAVGVLHPVVYLRSERLDGERRERLAAALKVECPRVTIASETQAARLLWRLHPERAWQRFVSRGMRRIVIADLFGVQLSQLPTANTRWLRR